MAHPLPRPARTRKPTARQDRSTLQTPHPMGLRPSLLAARWNRITSPVTSSRQAGPAHPPVLAIRATRLSTQMCQPSSASAVAHQEVASKSRAQAIFVRMTPPPNSLSNTSYARSSRDLHRQSRTQPSFRQRLEQVKRAGRGVWHQ
jgi:hypothetical protein